MSSLGRVNVLIFIVDCWLSPIIVVVFSVCLGRMILRLHNHDIEYAEANIHQIQQQQKKSSEPNYHMRSFSRRIKVIARASGNKLYFTINFRCAKAAAWYRKKRLKIKCCRRQSRHSSGITNISRELREQTVRRRKRRSKKKLINVGVEQPPHRPTWDQWCNLQSIFEWLFETILEFSSSIHISIQIEHHRRRWVNKQS